MARIFLCHASEDTLQVEAIYQRLKTLGFEPWMAQFDLLPGQGWRQEIPNVLRASALILIFFSHHAMAKPGQPHDVLTLVLETWRHMPAGQIRTIPVRLEACDLPDDFTRFHAVDVFAPDGFDQLLRALLAWRVGAAASADTSLATTQAENQRLVAEREQLLTALRNAEAQHQPAALHEQAAGLETQVARLQEDAVTHVPPPLAVAAPEPFSVMTTPLGMAFVWIPAGTFHMGAADGYADEQPVHMVHLSQPFYLGQTPMTQTQWQAVMGTNPSRFTGDDQLPVEQVSWDEIQECLARLNAQEPGASYRLPTEAEWEYACRAGTTTAYSFGGHAGELDQYAWYDDNAGRTTHPVGQKRPNAWGLYDMHGNVWEWVQDRYGPYLPAPVTNPMGPATGVSRVLRGGRWFLFGRSVRSALRYALPPDFRGDCIGFRLARGPAPGP